MAEPRLLEVGHIARAHGLDGSVVVSLVTNRVERLAPGSRLVARRDRASITLEVVVARPFKDRYLVRFVGVEDRTGAEALHGMTLFAPAIEDPEALFVHELIGSEVVERSGLAHGRVTSVEANPASDLLVVEGRYYVPLRFVVDREDGRLIIEAPPGLFE